MLLFAHKVEQQLTGVSAAHQLVHAVWAEMHSRQASQTALLALLRSVQPQRALLLDGIK